MATDSIPENPSDDELESLAEDLLGVNLKPPQNDVEPFEVGDFDLDDDEPAGEPEGEPADPATDDPPATPTDQQVASADAGTSPVPEPASAAEDDDFGAMLLDDDDAPPPPAKVVAVTESVTITPRPAETTAADEAGQEGETAATDIAEEASEPPAGDESASSEEDDYWDALEGFDWDEGSEQKKPASDASRKYVESTDTFEDLSIESAEKTDEFLDDADFGAGLDDESESAPSTGSASRKPDSPDSEETSERKKRRRRGGRRRGRRRRDRDDGDQAPASEEDASASQDADEDEQSEPVEQTADEGFGAGLEVESPGKSTGDEQPRKRRRRGGRRRRRRKAEDSQTSETTTAKDNSADQSDEAKSEPTGRRTDKYRSVPTWEEAIGYLVRRQPAKSGNGSRSRSGSRRGRRGSGRRRS